MLNSIESSKKLINFEYLYPSMEEKDDLLDSCSIIKDNNCLEKAELKTLQTRTKILSHKSKEAEDKPTTPKLKRSYSQPCLFKGGSKIKFEKEACQARDGFLWKCIGREPSLFGGYIYQYEIREEYNDFTSHPDLLERIQNVELKNKDLYPAIELSPKPMKAKIDSIKELRKLGYHIMEKEGTVIMKMPDREALLGAYQNLKEKYPQKNLPDFDIASSEGIADDLSFALEHFKGGLLSVGCEFCHDQHFHIIPRIERALEGIDFYQKTEKDLIEQIFSLYRKIYMAKEQNPSLKNHSEKLNLILGMVTDVMFSLPVFFLNNCSLNASTASMIANNFESPLWLKYIQKRFPIDTPTNAEIRKIWMEVEEAASDFVQNNFEDKIIDYFGQLKKSTTRQLIKENCTLFLQLEREGFFLEDLEKFDEDFLRWVIKNPDDFLWLKKKGLSPKVILGLGIEQQNFIINDFKQLENLLNYLTIQELFAFKDEFLFDPTFDKIFWDLNLAFKIFLIENRKILKYCNKIGISIEDISLLEPQYLQKFFIEQKNPFKQLSKQGISIANFSTIAKWFAVEHSGPAVQFINKGISLDDLLDLNIEAIHRACCNPVRLERLLKTGLTFEKILALSAEDQKNLIIYSEYIASDINQGTSLQELSRLAKEGPTRNYKRYEQLVKKVKEVCDLYMFMRGWEEQPELLTIKENWLVKIKQEKVPLPSFTKLLSEHSLNEYTPKCNPFEYCEIGMEEMGIDQPCATVFTSKVSPLMNYPQWNPAKHRHLILDDLPSDNHVRMFIHKIKFRNLSIIT
jgi:hypothetical protein